MPELVTFASRQPAAHIKGTVFDHDVRTSAEMLRLAHLDNWNVRLREIETDARSNKKAFEVIRDNPFDGGLDRLGISGERYGVAQNERVFGLFDDLEPLWSCAGQFGNGALIYGQVDSEREIVIDPNGAGDVLKPQIFVNTTHDSSGALTIGRTAIRMGCLNQVQAIFRDLQHTIKLRHTLSIDERLKKIRLAWKQNNAYFDALQEEATALYQKTVTDDKYFQIVGHLMGDRPEENVKGAQTKYDNNLELFAQAWQGQPNENIRGTAWGAYQALTERQQWGRIMQNTANGQENFAKAGMGLDASTVSFRQQALELVRAV